MKRFQDRRQRGAEYRHKKDNFSNSMGKALYLATKRPVPHGVVIHCNNCDSKLVKVKHNFQEVYLCFSCGEKTEVSNERTDKRS
jgi:DNA-directed RNA polymerase subunit RPC12/RpoP